MTAEHVIPAVITALPLLFGIAFIAGTAILAKEHAVLRWVAFLFLPISFWMSLTLGSQAVKTEIPAMIDNVNQTGFGGLMTDSISYTGWLFFILISYLVIYLIYWAFTTMQANKKKKLEY